MGLIHQRRSARPGVYEARGIALEQVGITYGPRDRSASWTAPLVPTARTRDASTRPLWGRVCPACGLTRSRAGLCDCNS